jgi:uncharacterized protein
MHFDIDAHTVYLARHGSHAYGTNIEGSDLDLRGVAIAPIYTVAGFAYGFEQHERKGDPDIVVFDLRKFMKLAADCNPNVLEVLFVDALDITKTTDIGVRLRAKRDLFLSKKARHTFGGYAVGQLKRIKLHRGYLLNPPKEKPTRERFGLGIVSKITPDMMGAFDKLAGEGHEVHPNVMEIVQKEKQYKTALDQWISYEKWKSERNPDRAVLEAKHGYDTKHAMHLVRLLRMCGEVLTGKGLIVKRPDAEELLDIRRGAWEYDRLIEYAEREEAKLDQLYEDSPLPKGPDLDRLNALCVALHESFWTNKAL